MSDVKWIKITTNIFDNEKVKLIESLPDCDTILVIWFKLLCLAGKSNHSGYIMLNDKIAYTEDMLVQIFNRPKNTIRLALDTFINFEMIEIDEEKFYISNWQKHQNIDGLDKIRLQGKERQKKFRANKKILELETKEKEEDKELDIELEGNVDNNVTSNVTVKPNIITDYTSNIELQNTIKEFKAHRIKKKSTMTDYALKLLLNKLDKNFNNDSDKIDELNKSIMNGWQSVCYDNKTKSNDPEWYDEFKEERNIKDFQTEKDDKKKMDNISLEEVSKRFNKL